jgi:hypothetical protein
MFAFKFTVALLSACLCCRTGRSRLTRQATLGGQTLLFMLIYIDLPPPQCASFPCCVPSLVVLKPPSLVVLTSPALPPYFATLACFHRPRQQPHFPALQIERSTPPHCKLTAPLHRTPSAPLPSTASAPPHSFTHAHRTLPHCFLLLHRTPLPIHIPHSASLFPRVFRPRPAAGG